jgi:hypothetical protein
MSFESIASGFGKMWGKAKEDKANKEAIEKDKRERMGLMQSLDYEPMYASQNVPTYQKTKSPVARSYLESFLMGNNPNATFSGAPNAAATKKGQQYQQNAMFGTPEQRIAQQRAVDAETPWKVTPPTRPVVGTQSEEALHTATVPDLAAAGVTKDLYQQLVDSGEFSDKELGYLESGAGGLAGSPILANAIKAGDYDAVRTLTGKRGESRKDKRRAFFRPRAADKEHNKRWSQAVDKYGDTEV